MARTTDKIDPPRTAAVIAGPAALGPDARKLLQPDLFPGPYLKLLIERKLYLDAIRFMAQALRRREAVWWACLCVRHTAADPLPEKEQAALRAAVDWVLAPGDPTAKQAAQAAKAAGMKTPAGGAAQAAGWASGPASPRFGKAVATAVLLSAARGPARQRSATYRQCVALGLDVDSGTAGWTQPAK